MESWKTPDDVRKKHWKRRRIDAEYIYGAQKNTHMALHVETAERVFRCYQRAKTTKEEAISYMVEDTMAGSSGTIAYLGLCKYMAYILANETAERAKQM